MSKITSGAEEDGEPSDFTPLTAQQAQDFRQQNPSTSPWSVVAWQVVVCVLLVLVAWAFTGKSAIVWSVAWGSLAVVLPAALFARGVTGQFARANPGSAVLSFFVWELVKIAGTVAVMFTAYRVQKDLSWPAMLVGLVVTMKVYWVALAYRRKPEAGAKQNA